MKAESEIIELSKNKLKVAEFLVENGFYDDAFYLGGYSIELLLKAKICKTLSIPDFFDFEISKNRKLPESKSKGIENLYKPFKVHDYEQLLILSGLYSEFSTKLDIDLNLRADWSVINKWNESLRYVVGANKADVESFINSIKNIKSWLLQYL